jgi:hypothetical protein
MNLELLQALALAVAANERAQRRFRNAVFIRLSNIETMVEMIHGAQIVEAHHSPGSEDKVKKHAKAAGEYVSRRSKELGLEMVEFVYDDSENQPAMSETRRKRSRSASYDI